MALDAIPLGFYSQGDARVVEPKCVVMREGNITCRRRGARRIPGSV